MGGLGISPDVARRLTFEEARFYLTSESRVKHACRAMNAVSADGRVRTPEELCRLHADDMKARRLRFTGSESLELTEAEIRGAAGDEGKRRLETDEEIMGKGHFDRLIGRDGRDKK